MSSLIKAMRPTRIIALPLTQVSKPTGSAILRQSLIYYHFQITKPGDLTQDENKLKSRSWAPEGGWVKWATGKAAQAWAGFGKAKEGSWKLRVYNVGERLVDRIDFEELALKGIDPSFGPSITHPDFSGHSRDDIKKQPPLKIPLFYAPSIQTGSSTLTHLMALVQHRAPKHRKGFYTWMLLAPLTAPFMIIPIIPNLPFFFCVWRSWHHYRAYRASQYVQALLESGAVIPEPSKELDGLYEKYNPKTTSATSSQSPSGSSASDAGLRSEPSPSSSSLHNLLLTRDAVPALLETFGLKSESSGDIYRALEQAKLRIQDGKVEP